MHRSCFLMSVGLLLGGYATACGTPYGGPCPAPAAVASPYAYPPPSVAYAQPYPAYEAGGGYAYVDQQPVAIVYESGYGGWGYYDHVHHWHQAPPGWRNGPDHGFQQHGPAGFGALADVRGPRPGFSGNPGPGPRGPAPGGYTGRPQAPRPDQMPNRNPTGRPPSNCQSLGRCLP